MNWTPEEKLETIRALTLQAENHLASKRLVQVWQYLDSIRRVACMDPDFLTANEATIREDMAP